MGTPDPTPEEPNSAWLTDQELSDVRRRIPILYVEVGLDTGADCRDGTGEIPPQYPGRLARHLVAIPGRDGSAVDRRDAGRFDGDQELARARHRIRHLA